MDAARCARRLVKDGEVTLVYRRTRAQMPADPAEVVDCLEEGIALRDLLAPAAVVAAAGRVTGLACTRMAPGRAGRLRPAPAGAGGRAAEEILPADTIIPAISQEPVLDFLEGWTAQRKQDGTLAVDPATRETSLQGLFAGGDVVHGPVLRHPGHRRRPGRGRSHRPPARHRARPEPQPGQGRSAPAAAMEKKARLSPAQKVPVLPLTERAGFEEVLHAFTPETAALEAAPVPGLRRSLQPVRHRLPEPVQPRLSPWRPSGWNCPCWSSAAAGCSARGHAACSRWSRPCRPSTSPTSATNAATAPPSAPPPAPPTGTSRGSGSTARASWRPRTTPSAWSGAPAAWCSRPAWGAGRTGWRWGRWKPGTGAARSPPASWHRDPGSSPDWEVRGNLAEGTEVDLTPCATLIVLLNAEPVVPDLGWY